MRLFWLAWCGFGLLPAALFAAEPPAIRSPQTSRSAALLPTAVKTLWGVADVGSDVEFDKLTSHKGGTAAVPGDMRKLIVAWPKTKRLRGWPQEYQLACEEGLLQFSGSSEIATALDFQEATTQLREQLAALGYRAVDDKKGAQAVAAKMGIPAERFEHWDPRNGSGAFLKKEDELQQVVFSEVAGYDGSRTYACGVKLAWHAAIPFPHAGPTLGDTFAALPGGAKATFLPKAFFRALDDERITQIRVGSGLQVTFRNDVRDKLIKALESNGFEYRSESEARRNGDVQKTWYRFTDVTYAHVTTNPSEKWVRFYCQTPQHKGEPIAVKPDPLHPSLQLPRSKRPILTLDQLHFADVQLQQRTKTIRDWAASIAEEGWFVHEFRDGRYSREPLYYAQWGTSKVRGAYHLHKDLPYRGAGISLSGTEVDGRDVINAMSFSGRWVPKLGWGAAVSGGWRPTGEGPLVFNGGATVVRVREGSSPVSFDTSFGSSNALRLGGNYVSVGGRDGNFAYWLSVAAPSSEKSNDVEQLLALYESPESLRDAVLADLDALRKQVHQQLESLAGMEVADMTHVRSDNPPMEMPATERPPPAATKEALLAQAETAIAQREKLVREHYEAMHAAIHEAFPASKLAMALFGR